MTVPAAPSPTIEIVRPTAAALVLGSTTPPPPDPGPITVVRRRSGGGAVLVEPGAVLWVDALIPRADRLWEDDVGRAAFWVGEAWAEALRSTGQDAVVHRGPSEPTDWSRTFCFAGIGPGEVTVAGRKVMGVAQRRTRHGARLQTTALLEWRPNETAAAYGVAPRLRSAAVADLSARAAGVGRGAGPALEAALLAALSNR